MDRETISSYSWLVISAIILVLLMAFANPFTSASIDYMGEIPDTIIGDAAGNCKHESTVNITEWGKYSGTQHQKYSTVKCSSCGKVLSRTATDVFQAHEYDSNYICTVCGFRHSHAHTEVIDATYLLTTDPNAHFVTYTLRCACGSEKTSNGQFEAHRFDENDECELCGYVKNSGSGSEITPTIIASNKSLAYGETIEIGATSNSGGALSYSCSDTMVATVDSMGVITSVKPGVATITITLGASGGYESGTKDITVTVTKGTQTISATNKSVDYNGSVSIGASLTRSGSQPNGTISYTSTATDVATVNSSGVVTGKKVGTTTITITAASTAYYNEASQNITVTVSAIAPTITAANKSVNVGSTISIGASANSGGALTYTSNNTSIATVNSSGVITGVAAGTTTITINVAANGNYTAGSKNITVTVSNTITYTWKKYSVNSTPGYDESTYEYNCSYHSTRFGDEDYGTVYFTDDDFANDNENGGALSGHSPGESWIEYVSGDDYEEYTYLGSTTIHHEGTQSKGSYIGTVSSTNSSAYPSNGVSGGYWYVKQ